MLNVLEAKIFQYDFPDKITVINHQHLQYDYTKIFGRQGWNVNNVSCIGNRIGQNFEPWDGF